MQNIRDIVEQIKFEKTLKKIVRVDHAGEFGAIKIYKAQQMLLSGPINEMLDHEIEHLKMFTDFSKEHKINPSIMLFIWSPLGSITGYVSALFGMQTAMAITVAIEEEIEQHYQNQLDGLRTIKLKDKTLKTKQEKLIKIIKKCKEDEEHHKEIADKEFLAKKIPFYNAIDFFIKSFSKMAIKISTHI